MPPAEFAEARRTHAAAHGPLRPTDIGDEQRLQRWQRERAALELEQADRQTTRRGQIVLWVIVLLLLLDVAVALAVIQLVTT